jgi:DNA-binding response OmpR family regulator
MFIISLHAPGWWRPGEDLVNISRPSFESCLLVAPAHVPTRGFVRALHEGGMAVLERESGQPSLALARTGEFTVVAWYVDPRSASAPLAIVELASAGVPIVAIHAEGPPELIAECLLAGADACLDIEADSRLVIAQVRAVLRRHGAYDASPAEASGLLQVGDLTVDVDRCEVQRAGTYVALTASEFRIVEFMARNNGRVLRPHEILNAVTDDYEYLPREAQDVLKVYVRRIRRKLEPVETEPRYLVTVRGFGYRLEGGAQLRPASATAHTA